MRYINVDTKLIGLLGMPLGQSRAHKMQNNVYERCGLDYFYFLIEVKAPDLLPKILDGVRAMNFAGLAVTKPYKETILKYLDEKDDLVAKMGACNTIAIRDGKLIGYNTDGFGCIHSLEVEGGLDLSGKSYFSFGAGGAARAVCFELANRGAKQIVISSGSQRCERLAEDINRFFPGVCIPVNIAEEKRMYEYIRQSDVLLNMSGIGMPPHVGETPMKDPCFQSNQLCYDAIYNPEKSRFLEDAEAAGCKILNGAGMTVYQGLEQIKIWTGVEAPAQIMFDANKESV